MEDIIVALIVACLGGAVSAIKGWLDGDEPFIPRKFISGVIRGVLGGGVLVVGLNVPVTLETLVMLFFAAVGFDVGLHSGEKLLNELREVNTSRKT